MPSCIQYREASYHTNDRNATITSRCPDPSPGPVLPERPDHPAQPIGRIVPVDPHRRVRGLRISTRDRGDDGLVLLDRDPDLIHERADVKANVTIGLRLDPIVQE